MTERKCNLVPDGEGGIDGVIFSDELTCVKYDDEPDSVIFGIIEDVDSGGVRGSVMTRAEAIDFARHVLAVLSYNNGVNTQ